MDPVEFRLPKDINSSFIVFREYGSYFPCPWHYHPEYEIVLITKSTGRRMVGDHIGYFEPGDLVFIGSWVPHLSLNDEEYMQEGSSLEADATVIHFKKDFLGKKLLKAPEFEAFNKVLKLSKRGLAIHGETREKISKIMLSMHELDGLTRLAALFQIFHILSSSKEYEILTSPHFMENYQLNSTKKFETITNYILKNIDKEIKLNEVANIANMSVSSFCSFFKKQFRVTFTEYINEVRVGHACKLLSSEEHNVTEIAYKSGYNSLAYFNRQFKKVKNMTPTEYRSKIVG